MTKSNSALDWLQRAVVAVLLILGFQGRGSHAVFVGLFLIIPVLRFILSARYRADFKKRWNGYYRALDLYSQKAGKIPWRALFFGGVLPTLLMVLVNGRTQSSQDNLPVMLTAASIIREGNVEISEFVPPPCPYFAHCTERGIYSKYPAGLLTIAVPFTATARVLGADLSKIGNLRIEKWAAAWLAAVVVGLFVLIALPMGKTTPVLALSLFLGIGSVVFSTIGQGLWSQDGVTLGILILLALEFVRGVPDRWRILGEALAIMLMAASRLTSITFLVPFGLWILVRNWRRGVLTILASVVFYLPWMLFYYHYYESPFGPQIIMGQATLNSVTLWSWNWWPNFSGLLFSPGRGALVYQPWLLLFVILPFTKKSPLPRDPGPRHWEKMVFAAIFLQLSILSFWGIWYGGACYGSRLLTETIPLSALLLVRPLSAAWNQGFTRATTWVMLAVSFWMHANGVYLRGGFWTDQIGAHPEKSYEEHLWTVRGAPFIYPFIRQE